MNRYSLLLCISVFLFLRVSGQSQAQKFKLLEEWNSLQTDDVDFLLSEQIRISLAYWYQDKVGADSLMDIMLHHPQILNYPERYVRGIWIKNNRTDLSDGKILRYHRIDSIACELDVSPTLRIRIKEAIGSHLTRLRYFEESMLAYEEGIELAKNYEHPRLKVLQTLLSTSRKEYDKEQKERILMLKKDQEIKLSDEKIRRYKISGLLASLLLALGLFTVFQLKKRNTQIQSQNKVISKALSDKDVLLREIHHRVKNNLQLVSSLLTLQGRSVDSDSAIQAIKEGQTRVRSMALIHQDLYHKESLTEIGVKGYVEKLTSELFATYRIDTNLISLSMDVDDMELDVDTLIPLGLIINELLTNSLKYAFPAEREGSLLVSLSKSDNQIELVVKDDGVGYDPTEVRDDSFGSTLIAALTEQLEGVISFETKLDGGTSVTIVIPSKM